MTTPSKKYIYSADQQARWLCKSPAYRSWDAMKQRVTNPHDKKYPSYGGRGIDMDPRWKKFVAFLTDMGQPPTGTTLGRIENNQGYWPSNCRWETLLQQANNTRRNHLISARGKTQTLAQWAREVGISANVLKSRITASGWDSERTVSTPVRAHRPPHVMLRCGNCAHLFDWRVTVCYLIIYGPPSGCSPSCRRKLSLSSEEHHAE